MNKENFGNQVTREINIKKDKGPG